MKNISMDIWYNIEHVIREDMMVNVGNNIICTKTWLDIYIGAQKIYENIANRIETPIFQNFRANCIKTWKEKR